MNLALSLDHECRRVARRDGLSLEDLMADLARLTGRSTRELYNYRAGKLPLPSNLLPILCRRFASFLLLDVLREECREERQGLPDAFDVTRLVAQTVREDMKHYEFLIEAFETNGIDRQELQALRVSGDRIIENVYQLLSVCEEDYRRREARRDAKTSTNR